MGATQHQPSVAPRGLSRADAARYVGVGVSLFNQMITRNLMPPARAIGGRHVWDIRELDAAFDELPHMDEGSTSPLVAGNDDPAGSPDNDFV